MATQVLSAAIAGGSALIQGRTVSRFSAQASVEGTGAVSATVVIEGSNNGGLDWVPISALTLSGTTRAIDGGMTETLWGSIRVRVSAISGTNAVVNCWIETWSASLGYL